MDKLKHILSLIKPFYGYAFSAAGLNILAVIFSVFSFTMLIPFLGMLFETQPLVREMVAWDFSTKTLSHNFNYYLSWVIINYGVSKALLFIGLFIGGTSLLKTMLTYAAKITLAVLRVGAVKELRNRLYNKVLELPIGFYSNERKGDLLSKMTNDVQEVESSLIASFDMLLRQPITLLIYLITLIFLSPHLTLFVLVLLPITGLIIGRIGKSLKNVSRNTQSMLGIIISVLEETLSGIRIIKAFVAEDTQKEKFQKDNDKYTSLMLSMWRKREMASPLSEFLGTLVVVILMWYGGSLVLDSDSTLSPAAFMAYLAIFSQIINPAKAFSGAWYNVQRGVASLERIETILFTENQITNKQGALTKVDFDSAIEFKDVSFKYKDEYVLKNVNLSVPKGKTVALVGQSGSGKSTLADLIPRFYDIEEGEILLDGVNIKDFRTESLRQLMGIVNQEAILFNDTVANNIAFGKKGAGFTEIENAAKVANAHGFITEIEEGYQKNIGDRGTKLSGGQRQRISIARAVLKNPPILILDEATSALDTESEKLVQDALDKLMQNRTAIVIAHRLSTIKNADLICVLHEGKIVEQGTHTELIAANGTYKKLHGMQTI